MCKATLSISACNAHTVVCVDAYTGYVLGNNSVLPLFIWQQNSGFQLVFSSSVQLDPFLISALWLPLSKTSNLVFHL